MKNFNIDFRGFRNMWKEPGNSVTCFSTALEVYFEKKKFLFLSAHLWIFGFQIFELVFERKKS